MQGRVWDGVFKTGVLRTQAFKGTIEGIPVVLLRPNWATCNIFRGSTIYGGSYNELEAYLYFSRHGLTRLPVIGSHARQCLRDSDVLSELPFGRLCLYTLPW